MTEHLVIVGASLAGLKAARELRTLGFEGAITMIGEENVAPYDRPPLSKEFLLGSASLDDVLLANHDEIRDLAIELVTGVRATGLDEHSSTVQLDTGETLHYDKLLVTTGARPRRPHWMRDLRGLHLLRTIDDATAIRDALGTAAQVTIVGGGFIGTEAAAKLVSAGKHVTVITDGPTLLTPLGADVAARFTDLHRERGVHVHTGVGVTGVHGGDHVRAVSLADGRTVAADLVLVAVGAQPNLDWAQQLADPLTGAARVDSEGRVRQAVWAAGDVTGASAGHWFSAVRQARMAARSILGIDDTTTARLANEVPYMWTDQYELKAQLLGVVTPDDEFTLIDAVGGTPEKLIGVFSRSGRITGGVVVDRPRELGVMRRLLTTGASVSVAETSLAGVRS